MDNASIQSFFENHELTLVGTFSRLNMVKPWFNALDKLEMPRKKIHLLIFDNSDQKDLELALRKEINLREKDFLSVKFRKSGRKGGRTILGQDNNNWKKSKLKPIWDMWIDLCYIIHTDVFFLIEDDTIAPPHAFLQLMQDFTTLDSAGFCIGIETGRTAFEWSPVRLGVHHIVRDGDKILKRISLNPNLTGVHEVDCAGVYCFITYTDLWRRAIENQKGYVASVPFFAMDNLLTNNMKKLGYKIYADFGVWCDHLQQSAGKMIAFNKRNAVQMLDIWIPEANNYGQCIEIKK